MTTISLDRGDLDVAPQRVSQLAEEVRLMGERIGLPLIAACADISSARPSKDEDGRPVSSLFNFTDAAQDYWRWGDLALRSTIITMVRHLAEPFYFDGKTIGGWRDLKVADNVIAGLHASSYSVRASIAAPIHLPRSTIGAVVWATEDESVNVRRIFERHAVAMHGLALRFISACDVEAHGEPLITQHSLTRREIQCLKLAAAGKTDNEIATILDLSMPTIRFHLGKASAKLDRTGRLRTVQRAVELGFAGTMG